MPSEILWIEDDKKFLHDTSPLIGRALGVDVNGVLSASDGLQELGRHCLEYLLVLLDLAMEPMDGIDAYAEIRRMNSQIPVVVASAHLDEPNWMRRLRPIEWDVKVIEKPLPMTTSPDFRKVLQTLRSEMRRYKRVLEEPFGYTLEGFLGLSESEMDEVFDKALRLHKCFVEVYFEEHKRVDWIVVAGRAGNIVAEGPDQKEPSEQELRKLAKDQDGPVFTYSRPMIIEEEPSGWSEKSTGDHYPTIRLECKSGDGGKQILGDFDTGARTSYLSYEELRRLGIISRRIFRGDSSGTLWSKGYRYYGERIRCRVVGKNVSRDFVLRCRAVKNWDESPLTDHFSDRVALIGRNLLNEGRMKLILDGEQKVTDVSR